MSILAATSPGTMPAFAGAARLGLSHQSTLDSLQAKGIGDVRVMGWISTPSAAPVTTPFP